MKLTRKSSDKSLKNSAEDSKRRFLQISQKISGKKQAKGKSKLTKPISFPYFKQSRSAMYSFIFVLPLLLIYEVGIFFLSKEDVPIMRNGADVLIRQILDNFDIAGLYAIGVFIFFAISIGFILQRKQFGGEYFRSHYYFMMLIESIAWSGILYLVLAQSQLYFSTSSSKLFFQHIILSVGAGVYEEFVFRVVLVSGLAVLFGLIMRWKYLVATAGAILGGAAIFSLFHFIGEFSEAPSLTLFIIRFIAGIALGVLYVLRGFGITAYAHSFYNLIVFSQVSSIE